MRRQSVVRGQNGECITYQKPRSQLTTSFGERWATSGAVFFETFRSLWKYPSITKCRNRPSQTYQAESSYRFRNQKQFASFLITDGWLRLDLHHGKDIITRIQIRVPFRGNSHATLLAPGRCDLFAAGLR